MIGLIIITHGRLAEELYLAMVHVVGPQERVARICVGADDDLELRRSELIRALAEVDVGQGAIIVTDMFGGSPSNLATSLMDREQLEVISGVNLPMLVKLAKVRGMQSLADASDCALAAGRKYIAAASTTLKSCRRIAGVG